MTWEPATSVEVAVSGACSPSRRRWRAKTIGRWRSFPRAWAASRRDLECLRFIFFLFSQIGVLLDATWATSFTWADASVPSCWFPAAGLVVCFLPLDQKRRASGTSTSQDVVLPKLEELVLSLKGGQKA